MEGYQIMQVQAQEVQALDPQERANVDSQVATAKHYPRDLQRAINNSIALATANTAVAQSCGYALPRGNKPITGPSVHLAKILAQQYGNIRAEAKVVQITPTQVVSRGTAWDMENNYAVAFEVRRSIVGKNGQRYNEDMITVTGNAANAIAYRNAVLAIIPKAMTDEAYSAAQRKVTGDITDEDKLIARRKKVFDGFRDTYGITEKEVLQLVGKETVNQVKADQLAVLIGIAQSLADGDTTVPELMKPYRTTAGEVAKIVTEAEEQPEKPAAK